MTAVTIQSIETTVGEVFSSAITRIKAIAAGVAHAADVVAKDAAEVAPFAQAVIAVVAPQDAAAAAAAVAMLNAVDAAIQGANSGVQGGVTVGLPAEMVSAWNSARSAILQFENSL